MLGMIIQLYPDFTTILAHDLNFIGARVNFVIFLLGLQQCSKKWQTEQWCCMHYVLELH